MKNSYHGAWSTLALLSLFFPAPSMAQETLFYGRLYPTSSAPVSVATGDFNGDGKIDLVTANYDGNNVSILLSNGNGTYAAKVDYRTGTSPQIVVAADVNGDGKLDIVTANRDSNSVSILLGSGNETFPNRLDCITRFRPLGVTLGDVNDDGNLDIVATNRNEDSVSVLLNVAERVRVSGILNLQGKVPTAPDQPLTFVSRAAALPDVVVTQSVAPDGGFSLLLPKRNGTLTIKGDKYLARRIDLNTMGGDVSNIAATLRAGDANNDNAADIADLLVLINAYNKISPNTGYNFAADFNGDDRNDITDLLLLIGNYNQIGD